jgi:phthalate 4,5-cis-dihydrodiol dehydrogenase
MDWNSELGSPKNPSVYWQPRKKLAAKLPEINEENLKSSQNFGGANYNSKLINQNENRQHQHFGTVIASCENADIRPMPWGVAIYSNDEHLENRLNVPLVPRSEVIDEIVNAIYYNVPPTHDGNWALANLEVSLAILESAKNREEITLKHQVPIAAKGT